MLLPIGSFQPINLAAVSFNITDAESAKLLEKLRPSDIFNFKVGTNDSSTINEVRFTVFSDAVTLSADASGMYESVNEFCVGKLVLMLALATPGRRSNSCRKLSSVLPSLSA